MTVSQGAEPARPDQVANKARLWQPYEAVRRRTESLCAPLMLEDYVVQSASFVSPPKWHLAHTSWFFEAFLLVKWLPTYRLFHPDYGALFNSYYQSMGSPWPRPQRGLLIRPTVAEVYRYRAHVDAGIAELLERSQEADLAVIGHWMELGMQHEQQHQELLLMDIKHIYAASPLRPAYVSAQPPGVQSIAPLEWHQFSGGIVPVGHTGEGFAYDNETPPHQVYLEEFALASRLTTNGEYLAFMAEGGYQRAEWWLADGWDTVQRMDWCAPLYWEQRDGEWWTMTLAGMRPVDPTEPVAHVSYYEADAFSRWAGKCLPTEAQWETVARQQPLQGNFAEQGRLHPAPATEEAKVSQLFGDLWEWTASPYVAYPGYRWPEGAVGEYNGKFMCNQWVLRGGSCVSPQEHLRATYRNFFYPHDRWQFAGIRLAGA